VRSEIKTIVSVLKISTYIVTSFTACPIGLAANISDVCLNL
jgi:hypothetical protein